VVSLMLVLTFLWLVVGPLHDSYAVFCFLLFIIVVLRALTHYVMIALPPTNMQYGIFGGYGDCCCPVCLNSSSLPAKYLLGRLRQTKSQTKLKNSRTAPMWRSLVVKVGRVLRRRDYACIL